MARKTVDKKPTKSAAETKSNNDYWEKHKKQKGKEYNVIFFYDWCKACGLCSSLCKTSIILTDGRGKPYIDEMDKCIGCRFCEIHCPDFAITVKERYQDRRRQ